MSKKNQALKDQTQTQTTTMADATRVVELNGEEITNLNGRIVPLLQVISGPEQGRVVNLSEFQEFIIGRSHNCQLVAHDTSCSRRHAKLNIADDRSVSIEDLGSTNGSKVNGKTITSAHPLQDGDLVQLGDNTRFKFSLSLEQDAKIQMDVYHRATRDPLTNAFNRRRFEESLDREIAYVTRGQSRGLGIMIFDVDHFKKVNDTYGHPAGDAVLKEIGLRIPELIRKEDIFARIGGEEFVILTRNESLEGLKILAERIRSDFENTTMKHDDTEFKFTVSIGISYMSPAQANLSQKDFVKLADEALYEAKNTGRNKICVKSPISAVK